MQRNVLVWGGAAAALLAIFGLVLFFIADTPEKALMDIHTSFKEHNLEKFEERVDIKGVSKSVVDFAVDYALDQYQAEHADIQDPDKRMGQAIGAAFIKGLKPMFESMTEELIIQVVEQGPEAFSESGNTGDLKMASANGGSMKLKGKFIDSEMGDKLKRLMRGDSSSQMGDLELKKVKQTLDEAKFAIDLSKVEELQDIKSDGTMPSSDLKIQKMFLLMEKQEGKWRLVALDFLLK